MAGTRKGGVNNFTVQESMNTNLGQSGSIVIEDTGVDVTPPDGHVFVAIIPMYASTYWTAHTLESPEPDRYINTAQASTCGGAANTDVVDTTIRISTPIYGRWNKIRVGSMSASQGLMCIVGK